MTARKPKIAQEHPIEIELRKPRSIGELEQMAGIGPDHAERFAFWIGFKDLEARQCLNAGVAELKRRVRAAHGLA